jgi:hypothetical protein
MCPTDRKIGFVQPEIAIRGIVEWRIQLTPGNHRIKSSRVLQARFSNGLGLEVNSIYDVYDEEATQ